jgi:hypothetical protein
MQHGMIGIAAALGIPQGAIGAERLDCPEPAKLGPAATGELASELVPDPRALNDVGVLTRTVPLFREHGFSDADTVNYLTALFCPVVRDDGSLSATVKSAKVSSFSSAVSDIVYRQPR